jgi:hypothetical protein
MTKTTTLMLAAFAALTVGASSAMAQDGGDGGMDYWSRQNVIAARRALANPVAAPVQAGSSDVQQERGSAHSAEYIFQHHLYGAGGTAG